MRKIVAVVAGLAVLVVVVVVALPFMVPTERIGAELAAGVKAATGRDLTLNGKVAVSVFPSLSVEVADVGLSNPPGYSTKDFARLGALSFDLKLMPLLSGRVEVDKFVLVNPAINLETDRQGRPNWRFAKAEAKPGKPDHGVATEPAELRLGDVRIRGGRIAWMDARTGVKQEFTDAQLTIRLAGLDSPLSAKGAVQWRGKETALDVEIAKPRALLDDQPSALAATLGAEALKLSLKGQLDPAKGELGGDVDLDVPSLRNLVQWVTGTAMTAPGPVYGPLSIKGKIALGGSRTSFTQAALRLDALRGKGSLTVDTAGARPVVRGSLEAEPLDLDPYLPPAAEAKGKSDWSDEAIDATALKAAEIDATLAAQGLKIRNIQFGRSAVKLVVKDGKLTADLAEMALYGGAGKARLALDGNGAGLGLDASVSAKNVKAEPLLADAAGFDRLQGTAAFDIQIAGKGRSQRALVSDLSGKGQITFVDGAIKGINLAAMVRNVTSAFSETGSQNTDFSELSGSFVIAKGILTNKDLTMKSPLLRVAGAGTADLPRRSVKYRIEPKAVASIEGQGGKADLGGIQVPVIVEGPWDAPTWRPDLGGAVEKGVGKAMEGALGGKAPTTTGTTTTTKPALPVDPKKLLGR